MRYHGDPAGRDSGFTLLELMVAFTILALVSGMVFASLRMALNAYVKSQDRIEEQATRRILFEQIRRQVGSIFPVRPTAGFVAALDPNMGPADPARQFTAGQVPLFHGEQDFMTFVTVAPLVLIENSGLTVVRYGLAQDEQGGFYLGAMENRYTGEASFGVMVTAPIGKPLALVENVKYLEFQYYGLDPGTSSYGWFSSWHGDETGTVPEAIRINFNSNYVLVPVNASFLEGNGAGMLRRAISGVLGE